MQKWDQAIQKQRTDQGDGRLLIVGESHYSQGGNNEVYSAWKTFIELIKILNPTDCVFIGVSASNSFNQAMEELRMKYEPVKWLEGIGTANARTATLNFNDNEIKLSFIQHASQMFSWREWNTFLARENQESLTFLKAKVFQEAVEVIPDEILEPKKDSVSIVNVPSNEFVSQTNYRL